MIEAPRLLADCQRLVRTLEDDLRERLTEHPDLDGPVRAEYEKAKERGRTGQSYTAWRDEYLTQVAVHWVLAAVFLRFLEDNGLLPEPLISGPGARLAEARDRQERFFTRQPAASDRDYLLDSFREVRGLPALKSLFDERHNPLFQLGISADGAKALLALFRKLDPASGALVHDFVDPDWNTRFLGDLYQDLSEAARKRYALLQTPEFVEEFILDRTLEPAMDEIGYANVNMIDPACGSGHFVLGAFHRIFARSQKAEPGIDDRKLVLRALQQVAGVDANPFAIAIARFRLLVAALKVSGLRRMIDAPNFQLNLATGDSLLFGERLGGPTRGSQIPLVGEDRLRYVYETEDAAAAHQLLSQRYTVVAGNPPYITPRDSEQNKAYRARFGSCFRQYPLALPFTERFFDLAAIVGPGSHSGWVGLITANSFMKREFGKELIETYFPRWDLTHIIDTSGAYIPGHGTSTVILIGRNRNPVADTVRVVMGIQGEVDTPLDPSKGLVWSAILAFIDKPKSESPLISVADMSRSRLHAHPWSIAGGGASELKELIDDSTEVKLRDIADDMGFGAVTREDEAFMISSEVALRKGISSCSLRPLIAGEDVRDWEIIEQVGAIWPYNAETLEAEATAAVTYFLWPWRLQLADRVAYGLTQLERGLSWFEYSMFFRNRYRSPLSLAFAEVATHNHFVFDQGQKIFNRTAPLIKLPEKATESDHLDLLGILNSSVACFWLRQVCFPKGGDHVGTEGARVRKTLWEERFAFNTSNLADFPVSSQKPTSLALELMKLARQHTATLPRNLVKSELPSKPMLHEARDSHDQFTRKMIALQEELDWQVYRFYGLLEDPLELDPDAAPEVELGERPFEIALARRMAAGEIETKWFERHGSTPITEIPERWPEPYRLLIEKRLKAIEENPWIRLIEQPEYKRRWNREPWEEQEKRALRDWLLDRLEDPRYWPEPRVTSTGRLADRLRQDDDFRQVAALYKGRDDFDWTALVTELTLDEAVPFLAVQRYTDAGLRKRAEWEETWRLQRLEDAIDARTGLPEGDPQRLTEDEAKATKAREVGVIPVPPRYASADFRKTPYWRLRGKLDVPKERFVSYPGLERGADTSPVIGWAGWNHLQQAQALGTALHELRENEGWQADRLAPILAGLLELLPWLRQWHNDPDPAHGGTRLGDFFAGFVEEEARSLGLTREALETWKPQEGPRRGRKARSA